MTSTPANSTPPWWNLWRWFQTHPRHVLCLIFAVGIFLRWWDLAGSRPLHHDESLHGMYSLYGFERPDSNFYKYQPLLHGPLLFNCIPWAFDLLGKTDFATRFPMAVMGTIMLFMPWFFRRYLSPKSLFTLTLFIALSPELVYWSRFSREDYFMVSSLLWMLGGATLASPALAPLFVWFGIGWMLCVKESSFVFMAIFLGYLIYEFLVVKCLIKLETGKWSGADKKTPMLWQRLLRNFQAYPWSWVLGFTLGAFFYCYLYSAGFQYPEGILDGLYRKSLSYWWEQHSVERIKGPFAYSFFVISWYDLPWTLALIYLQFHFFLSRGKQWAGFFLGIIVVAAGLSLLASGHNLEDIDLTNLFKLKIPFDIFLCIFILANSLISTTLHIKEGDKDLAFFGYFFWANFFTYGYLGEKVPWLALYPFISGLIYFALYLQKAKAVPRLQLPELIRPEHIMRFCGLVLIIISLLCGFEEREPKMFSGVLAGLALIGLGEFWKRKLPVLEICSWGLIALAFTLYTTRATIMTNFGRAGEQHQIIGQVHTTWDLDRIMRRIRHEFEAPTKGQKPTIYLQGDALWPITWYLRDIPTYRFVLDTQGLPKYDYAFLNLGDPQASTLRKTHFEQIIPLRGWWVPDYNLMTLRKFLLYTFFYVEWNPIGNFNIYFFSRRPQTIAPTP